MKLRIRSTETKETFRLDVSPASYLADLKALVADRIAPAASSSSVVRLSLNRRDELADSSTLQSLGVASGDLLFYTLNPSGFSPSASGQGSVPPPKSAKETLTVAPTILAEGESEDQRPYRMDEVVSVEGKTQDNMMPGNDLGEEKKEQGVNPVVDDVMEVDVGMASTSVPGFLKRVLEGEKENERAKSDLGVLVISVHAVFLESGFLVHNCEGTRMPEGWASKASTVSISYTIPELSNPNFRVVVETVELKILLVGKFADVYGYLRGSSELHRLCLDASKYVPSVVSSVDTMSVEDEKVVFELWKTVKDRLSLPLLIDICEKNGLPPPPCFTCLPTELKIRTLDLLSGVDLARVGCVNSELRYISSNDDLWKQKFVEEFPCQEMCRRGDLYRRWKDKFAACWEGRNKRHRVFSTLYQFGVPPLLGREPAPFGVPVPNVIGADYDRFPAIGLVPGRLLRARPPFLQGQPFIPHCGLGGFNA